MDGKLSKLCNAVVADSKLVREILVFGLNRAG